MLLNDMVTYLSSGGGWTGGTNLFAGLLPPTPDEAIAIYETGGTAPEHTMGNVAGAGVLERPRVQVISRASTYEVARANAQKAWLLLDKLPTRTINGVQYYYGQAVQSPFLMGRDEQQGSPLVAFNVDILKAMSTTS